MKCQVCGIEFESKRTDAKYCSPKCRKEASRLASIVTDNVTLSDIPVTLNFEFTVRHKPANDNVDTSDIAEQKAKVRKALYWYDVPLGAIPVIKKDWPKVPKFPAVGDQPETKMNGRQYFLWWKNEFKLDGDKPIIHNPFPIKENIKYEMGGEGSRRWGA